MSWHYAGDSGVKKATTMTALWICLLLMEAVSAQGNFTISVQNFTAPPDINWEHCPVVCSCQVKGESSSIICPTDNSPSHNSSLSPNSTWGGQGIQTTYRQSAINFNTSAGELWGAGDCRDAIDVVLDGRGLYCANLSGFVAVQSVRLAVHSVGKLPADVSDLANATSGQTGYNGTNNTITIGGMSVTSKLAAFPALGRLDLSANGIEDLSGLCGSYQSNITELDVSVNNISGWSLDSLGCLLNLQSLDISNNLLESLEGVPMGAYPTDIKYLNLSYNRIRALPRGALASLGRLVNLDLSHNLLVMLQPGTFACHLDQVEVLSLAGNQIVSLAKSAFTGLSNIRHLNLSDNLLDSVEGESFMHAAPHTDCHTSDLDNNDTHKLDNTSRWNHFDTIDLSYNNISTVKRDWFRSAISNSRVIIFSHNRIKHFPRYGLERLPRLERLSLDHNKLYWLDVGTFTSRTLKYINLSRNKLNKIISMTFLFLPDIEMVDLSYNELNFIYKVAFYKSCKHDQRFTVNLSNNYLTEDVTWALVTSFRHLTATQCVVDVVVRNNRLKGILGNSKHIYERHLRLMDAPYFDVWDHVTLDLQDNPLKCNCDLMNDVTLLSETRKLFLGNISNSHHLTFWEDVKCVDSKEQPMGLTKAIGNMMCTSLLQCPYECNCYFDKVTIVNCTRRSLVAIPYDLPPGEKRVYMSENYIMEIEDGSYLNNITFLDLSANALIEIEPESLLRLSPSVTLLLHSNVLSQIPDTISHLQKSGHVTLRNNPISCDCENWWFVDWMMNHTDTIMDFDNMTCDNNRHIMELDPALVMSYCKTESSFLKGRSVSVLYASLAAALAIGFLSLIIVTLVIHSRRRILPVLMNRLSWYRLNLEHEAAREKVMLWYSPLDEDWVKNNIVEALRSNLPLHTLCPYHQCLVQDDNDVEVVSESQDCIVNSFNTAKCIVVVLSENFLDTEWSAFEDWQVQDKPNFLLDNQQTPLYFLSIESTKLVDYPDMCEIIKRHSFYDVTEMLWLESLLDSMTSILTSRDACCEMDWTDEESLSLREEKY